MTDTHVRFIQKEEILAWIRRPNVRGYKYKPNVPGSWFLIVVGCLSLGLAAFLAHQSHLVLPIHKAGFAVLASFTLWGFWIVFHWSLFAARNYLALDDDYLLIGRGSRAYVIPRSRLNAETIGIDRIRTGKYTSALPIKVDHYETTIHLIGPFANLDNLQLFIAEILTGLMTEEEETEESAT